MYCSLTEAWGNDVLETSENPEISQLSMEDMHTLPGYTTNGNICSLQNVPQQQQQHEKKNVVQMKPIINQYPQNHLFQPNTNQSQMINAMLYIVSGIYLIYTMDMFMRMGMHMR